MRRLVNTFLISEPSRRVLSGDQVLQTEPSGRYFLRDQRPEGFVLAMGFFLLEPSGRFAC
jgi:hypothetical protein